MRSRLGFGILCNRNLRADRLPDDPGKPLGSQPVAIRHEPQCVPVGLRSGRPFAFGVDNPEVGNLHAAQAQRGQRDRRGGPGSVCQRFGLFHSFPLSFLLRTASRPAKHEEDGKQRGGNLSHGGHRTFSVTISYGLTVRVTAPSCTGRLSSSFSCRSQTVTRAAGMPKRTATRVRLLADS